ncbi:uncharacterized protein LOC144119208 isoform X2 [Amblyomma americanum]
MRHLVSRVDDGIEVKMAASSRDVFGVLRGRCTEDNCDCPQYMVLPELKLKCEYCGHCPSAHGKINEIGSIEATTNVDVPDVSTQETVGEDDWSDHGTQGDPDSSFLAPPSTSQDTEEVHHTNSGMEDDSRICQLSKPPTKPKEFYDWLLRNMPAFSEGVQPVLYGKMVSEIQQKRLCKQLRAEIALFLNENDLIMSNNTAECRWLYKGLGDALLTKYPLLKWDDPEPGSNLRRTRNQVYSVFIRRLSVGRKVRRHREKKKIFHRGSISPSHYKRGCCCGVAGLIFKQLEWRYLRHCKNEGPT